jgi:2-polyprenyl-3-methyl-5-hydroxy-6-metoxy-1,4-benzoquinol methylase/glycosyltransferase involved in cell wall biosynthesis
MNESRQYESGYCVVCGCHSSFRCDPTLIIPQLQKAWGISDNLVEAFNRKESMFCGHCGASLRIRRLAAVLIQTFAELKGISSKSIVELIQNHEFRRLKIAEINACGVLHSYLKDHPNLYYSEWVSHAKAGEVHDGVRSEDLQQLTYPDNYFDIILTSETLEHVPDPDRAWREISRTLKGGGFHIFTIPIVPWQRETIKRARVVGGRREDLLEPAYHSPWGREDVFVYTDFGMDVIEKLNEIELSTEVFYLTPEVDVDVAVVFRSHKNGGHVEVAVKATSPLLEWTGERYLPWLEEAAIGYEHLHRYAYTTQFMHNKRVLDLACGEGYGSYLLARSAESVVGIDIDEKTIKHARNKYIKRNLEFKVGSITEVPITGERLFDVAVCFEALEHIEDHEKLLSEVKRLLTPDGVFIVSTPNKTVYSDEPQFNNPFHVHELYFDEFRALFEKYFKKVKFLGQRIYCDSHIWPVFPGGDKKVVDYVIDRNPKEFVFVENDKRIPLYFIAIASDTESDIEETGSALIDVSDAFLKQKDNQIAAHAREQERLGAFLKQKDNQIAAHAREQERLGAFLKQKDNQIAAHAREQERLAGEIGQLSSAAEGQRSALAESRRTTAKLQEEKDKLERDLQKQQSQIHESQQSLIRERAAYSVLAEARRKELDEKEGRIAALEEIIQQREAVLNHIYQSHGWKALTVYYQLRNKLLPENTKRRELAKYLWRCLGKISRFLRGEKKGTTDIMSGGDAVQSASPLSVESVVMKPVIKEDVATEGVTVSEAPDNTYGGNGVQNARTLSVEPAVTKPIIKEEENGATDVAHGGEQNVTKRVVIKEEAVAKQEAVTVSVVIPTKNGGEDFRRVLATIANQKGFRQIEIIVVDSGSTDKTVDLADQFAAKVIKILPEEFTHSYARNLGARHASGQYLLFTVQDALPPSDSWLHELFSVIKNNQVVAVSCAEFPAASADLFYRAISWNHYRFLEVDNADRLMSKNGADDHISLRKNGQLSDLACLISRDVFAQYEYKTDYGEDLDLGLRLIRDGYSLAFLGSTRIIHSHNRPAYYYLKRSYVENLFVPKIFSDYPILSRDFDPILRDVVLAYQAISSLVAQEAWELQLPCKTVDFSSRLVSKFEGALKARPPIHGVMIDDSFSDPEFVAFLKRIINEGYENKTSIDSGEGIVGEAVMNFTKMVLTYMEQTYEFVDSYIAEDFRSSLHKAFAYQCGAQFAGCFLKYRGTGNLRLEQIHGELSKGV